MDSLIHQLEQQVAAGNVDDGLATLQQIKIARLSLDDGDVASSQYYIQALELGVLLSVAAEDMDGFNRNIQQLQPLYNSSSTSTTGRRNHIIGLNLMSLLVDNRLSEFHSEIELLVFTNTTSNPTEDDPYIQFPIALERKMMVGVYDEVLQMTVPDPSYQFFMNQMVRTVRDSIADCMEVSYQQLSVTEAIEILKCTDETDLRDYIESARDDWIISADTNTITFQPDAVVVDATAGATPVPTQQDIPSMKWIQQALAYATEMELIV